MSYTELCSTILDVCQGINIQFSKEGDGRIVSAIKESEYLDLLEKGLLQKDPSFILERPKERYWYDIRINQIPVNLKLTTGGTDNAFNKTAILYTLSGEEIRQNMNYNEFFKTLQNLKKKLIRDPSTEYHYLVVNKDTGKILFKSILDIHTYKSNPCNDLQINWNNEFKNLQYKINNDQYQEKCKELLGAIQTSVKKAVEGMKEFAEADLTQLFTEEH